MTAGAQVGDDVALFVQVHVGGGGQRGFFTEVEERLAPVRQLDGHETTTPQVTRRGIDHRQRVTHRNGGVDRVATVLQHIHAHMAGQVLGGDHHAVFGGDRGHGGRMGHQAAERQ